MVSLGSTDTKQIRKFGFMSLVFFGCLSLFGFWMKKSLPMYFFGFVAILGFGFVLIPARLKPVYTAWLKIAHFVGKIMTALLLTLAYCLVITPAGLIRRLFGGPLLPVKPDREVSSYWVARSEPAQPKERFLKRY